MRRERSAARDAVAPSQSRSSPAGTRMARALLALNRMAGNAAVARLLARDTAAQAPPKPKPKPLSVGAITGGPIEFETKKATVGDVEVFFQGRLTVLGTASLEGDAVPEDDKLPDPKSKDHSARVHKWVEARARDQLKAGLDALTPSGTAQEVTIDIFGRTLRLQLAHGVGGMPEFVVHGQFDASKAADIRVGTVNVPKATLRLEATAVVKPAPSKGSTVTTAADDSLIGRGGFSFDGVAAEFDDRPNPRQKTGTFRTGAVALSQTLKDMDGLPDVVKKRWLSTTEKKIAFLAHMRSYFATDGEIIEHFKKLRPVELHKKGVATSLILHDEAATRLEAVRDEMPAGAMPSSDVGWPRGEPSLHGRAGVWNLHDLGFAVDFNATETPNLTNVRQQDLVLFVTGGQAWQRGPWTEGSYSDLAKHTAERAPMADPDPSSDLGKKIEKAASEAQAASDRSEAFRSSVDTQKLLELRANRREHRADWSATDDAALAKVVEPWTQAVDKELAANRKTLEAAGFDVGSLKTGQALAQERGAVKDAAAAAASFRKKVKGPTLTDAQRKQADAIIEKLTGLVKGAGAKGAAPGDDAERLKAIDDLALVAEKRLSGYGAAEWRERVANLRKSLGDAGWVLGDSDWNPQRHRWETQVVDPSPTQLADLGFFTLRDHSHSAPGGKPQPGAFDIPFIKAMVKHGFNQLSNSSRPLDSMHFELRWHGSAEKSK